MLADALTKALVYCPSLLAAMNARSLRVCDLRFQRRREDNLADALRACTNSQDGNWMSACSISRIAIWKVWSEHSLNSIESGVSEMDFITYMKKMRTFEHHVVRCRLFECDSSVFQQFVSVLFYPCSRVATLCDSIYTGRRYDDATCNLSFTFPICPSFELSSCFGNVSTETLFLDFNLARLVMHCLGRTSTCDFEDLAAQSSVTVCFVVTASRV